MDGYNRIVFSLGRVEEFLNSFYRLKISKIKKVFFFFCFFWGYKQGWFLSGFVFYLVINQCLSLVRNLVVSN